MLAAVVLLLSEGASPFPNQAALTRAMEEHRRVTFPRRATVEAILAAIQAHDPEALEKTSAVGAPYFLDRPPVRSGIPSSSTTPSRPFTIDSLAPLAGCTHDKPSGTGIDWITVQWRCPAPTALPWSSVATAFKFEGQKIVQVRTGPGLPTMRIARFEPPKPIERASWITSGDYPPEAKATGAEGTVRIELQVRSNGDVAACKIMATSGHLSLDEGTCTLLMARARFVPAHDKSGNPITGQFPMGVVWSLPE